MIYNFHVYPSQNIGDNFSSPCHYFTFSEIILRKSLDDINLNGKTESPKAIIIGGGGILAPFAVKQIEDILKKYKNKSLLVGWGLGQNFHFGSNFHEPKLIINKLRGLLGQFDVLGLRDETDFYEWIPCVSCMHPLLSSSNVPKHDFVIYEHKQHPIEISGFPKMSNFQGDMKSVIDFISSGDSVITNSYHGVYWATLLNRKVICIPFASRFMATKFPPIYINEAAKWREGAKLARNYPEARSICVRQNINFYQRVANRLLDI